MPFSVPSVPPPEIPGARPNGSAEGPRPANSLQASIPNLLSFGRLLATPLVVTCLLVESPQRIAAVILFSIASFTDYLDGSLARRWNVVSSFGALCDLMADKLLVATTLIALVSIHLVPAWMVIIIVGRELLVSGLRSWAAERHAKIPAGIWGKGKTLLTLIAIAIAIINWSATLSYTLLFAATGLTVASAIDYIYQAWKIGQHSPSSAAL